MYEIINQKIAVLAAFGHGFQDATPLVMRWNGRRITLTQIGYHHKVKEGAHVVHVFSVSDGQSFYELRFTPDNLEWQLGKVSDGPGANGF